jgi:hypothetical protein
MVPNDKRGSMRDGRGLDAAGVAKTALLISALSLALSAAAFASDLRVETGALERVSGTGALRVSAKVSWKNAWRNEEPRCRLALREGPHRA